MDAHKIDQLLRSLDIAWNNIGNSSGDLDLPDIINNADVRFSWKEYRTGLVQSFCDGGWCPSGVEVVDLPKDRVSVRPLARLDLPHRLLYEAAVAAAANRIEAAVPPSVYSYRWWSRAGRVMAPKTAWMRMQDQAGAYHKKNQDLMLASSDISSFYENVDVDTLMNDLGPLRIPSWSRSAIGEFLGTFNGLSNVWGLPQGSNMSGMLANLYLTTLDAEIRRTGLQYFRYSDDFYIFGEDWQALREVLIGVNRVLRHRRLTLSNPKTKLVSGEEVTLHFEDREKDAISYGVRVRKASAGYEARSFFDNSVTSKELQVRDVRFALGQLGILGDSYATSWVLSNLHQIPHSTREACLYLELVAKVDGKLMRRVSSLLSSSTLSSYPYSQQHLLIFMIRNGIKTRSALDAAWNILLDRTRESFVREMAARYLGLYGPPGEVARLKQEYQVESNRRVQRALLIACYESRQCPDRWLNIIQSSDSAPRWTVRYLQSKPSFIPRPIVLEPGWH